MEIPDGILIFAKLVTEMEALDRIPNKLKVAHTVIYGDRIYIMHVDTERAVMLLSTSPSTTIIEYISDSGVAVIEPVQCAKTAAVRLYAYLNGESSTLRLDE